MSLPIKIFIKEFGRATIKAYALNPGTPPDSVHRILSAPNKEMKGKYFEKIGINKLHLHEYENAEKFFLEAAKFDTIQKEISYYNIACAYALENDTLNSLHWLKLSFENGFDDIIHALKEDQDLESIRNLSEFRPIVTMNLIKDRKELLEEIKNKSNSNISGVNYYLISESYLKQADPDSFYIWFAKALQNNYCPNASFFDKAQYDMQR